MVWFTFFLSRIAVLLIQAFTGWYLGTAIAAAIVWATVSAVLAAERYDSKERGFRFGVVGSSVMMLALWVVVFAVSFFFFYFPASIWPGRL
jgi:hypothetical protein